MRYVTQKKTPYQLVSTLGWLSRPCPLGRSGLHPLPLPWGAPLAPKLICCPAWGVLGENGSPHDRLQAAPYQILGKRIDTGTLGSSSVPLNPFSSPTINTSTRPSMFRFLSFIKGGEQHQKGMASSSSKLLGTRQGSQVSMFLSLPEAGPLIRCFQVATLEI